MSAPGSGERASDATALGAVGDATAERRLLDALCAEGLLGGGRRRIVERERAVGTAPLEELLIDNGFADVATLARLAGDARAIDLDDEFVPDAQAVACLDAAVARRWQVVPLALDGEGVRGGASGGGAVGAGGGAEEDERRGARPGAVLTLASAGEPELPRRDAVRRALSGRIGLRWRVASGPDVARALDRCYGVALELDALIDDCDAGDDMARLVDAFLSDAVARRASDIHLSPEERFVRVRYRVDGVLVDARCLQRRHLDALAVRVKVLAGADIAETRRPQDGRFSRRVQGRRVDFRFSSFPLRTGENLVLRVLERRRALPALTDLVHDADTLAMLRRMTDRPDGLIVACGPTGAGKTTTLYALLGEHDLGTLNVMTLEDPIEHPALGVRQASIDGARGLDYAHGVRALLRQDPDVLLIGEVRDAESCAMALRAALTGHKVLTTVHASDAVAAIGRLRELGAEPAVLADVLTGIVAQRLVRVRCTLCDERVARDAQRCPRCDGCGLHGRRAVLETLLPGERFAARLRRGGDGASLVLEARRDGHVTLRERASALLESGITTAVELARVFGPDSTPPSQGERRT